MQSVEKVGDALGRQSSEEAESIPPQKSALQTEADHTKPVTVESRLQE